MRSLLARPALRGSSIRLFDVNAERLEQSRRYGEWLGEASPGALRISAADSRSAALEEADFVALAVSVGGERMRSLDVGIPLGRGIVHVKGDTTGPAGIFRGLRGISFILELAREMERRCPRAFLLNVSNPLTVLTRAVGRETSIRAVGFCSCITEMRGEFARILGCPADSLDLQCLGVNHFTWMTGIYRDGRDVREEFEESIVTRFREGLPVTTDLYDAYGAFPVPGYKYASEFFPWFLGPATDHGKSIGFMPDQASARTAAAEARSAVLAEEMARPHTQPTRELSPSTEEVADFVEAAVTGRPRLVNANTPNGGRIPSAPFDAVLEGPVLVAGESLRPLVGAPLPTPVVRLLERVIAEQELVVEAGVAGSRDALFEAFLMDALVPSLAGATEMIDEMLEAQKEFLPAFQKRREARP
jgi:alpha-galactosidase